MVGNCKHCKHFDALPELARGFCNAINHDSIFDNGLAGLTDPAALFVSSDFGCVLFDKKETK